MRAESSVLQSLEGYQVEQLVFLFADRAPITLRRDLSGWRRWISFCSASGISAGLPECRHIVDWFFMESPETSQEARKFNKFMENIGLVNVFQCFFIEIHGKHWPGQCFP